MPKSPESCLKNHSRSDPAILFRYKVCYSKSTAGLAKADSATNRRFPPREALTAHHQNYCAHARVTPDRYAETFIADGLVWYSPPTTIAVTAVAMAQQAVRPQHDYFRPPRVLRQPTAPGRSRPCSPFVVDAAEDQEATRRTSNRARRNARSDRPDDISSHVGRDQQLSFLPGHRSDQFAGPAGHTVNTRVEPGSTGAPGARRPAGCEAGGYLISPTASTRPPPRRAAASIPADGICRSLFLLCRYPSGQLPSSDRICDLQRGPKI